MLLGAAMQSLVRADRCLLALVRDAVQEHVATRPRDAGLFEDFFEQLGGASKTEPFDPTANVKAMLAARKHDTHRKIIVGALSFELMRRDPRLRARIEAVLMSSAATSSRDAGLFGLHDPVTYLQRI